VSAPAATPLSGTARGILWMLLAVLGLATAMVSARALKDDLHTFEMLFLRAGIGFLLVCAFIGPKGWGRLRTARPVFHGVRNATHLGGQYFLLFALIYIPLGQVTALEFAIPIFTTLIAAFVLRERVGAARWASIAIGFAGVLVIVRPGFGVVHPAALLAVLATVCFAASNNMVKVLTRTESVVVIVFWMHLMQALFALVPALPVWVTPAPHHWPWVLGLSVGSVVSHYAMTRSVALADLSVIFPFDFLRLPVTALAAWAIWGETIDVWTVAGAAIIFTGSYWTMRRETRRPAGADSVRPG
jgi:drug/metabolite transporter (DMT)-like permease